MKKIIDILAIVLPALIILLGFVRLFSDNKKRTFNGSIMFIAILLLLVGLIRNIFFSNNGSHESGPKAVPLTVSKHSHDFNGSLENILNVYYVMTEAFSKNDTLAINQSGSRLKLALDSLKIDELKKDTLIYQTALDPLANATNELGSIVADPSINEKKGSLNIFSDELFTFLRIVHYDIAEDKLVLVAGERRLEASRQAGLPDIPVRYVEDLSPIELQIIELEENVKRRQLEWADVAKGISKIHELYKGLDAEWTMAETADSIGMSQGQISLYIQVSDELESNPKIGEASTAREAYNVLKRREQRATAAALQEMLGPGPEAIPLLKKEEPKQILQENFLEWAPSYEGEKFQLIHCDFPYGVGLFSAEDSRQMKKYDDGPIYPDSPETYFKLLECLVKNLDRLLSISGHIMFWYSQKHLARTLLAFETYAPQVQWNTHPLVWHKSDNAGMVPDPRRWPRHVYETCLLGVRGERFLMGLKSDLYPCPSDNVLHPSAKPEPMLRHFMSMLVDEHTSVLDPTCGAGSSLRAADSLGAKHVIGLEIEPSYAELANARLVSAQALRRVSLSLNKESLV